jgi:hypothetical protein
MTFKRSCIFNPMPIYYDELGPYAITRTTGGAVQPFGEVGRWDASSRMSWSTCSPNPSSTVRRR